MTDSRSSSMEVTLNDIRENMEHTADPTEEYFLTGVSGEPKMCPRVGDQYQAAIPDLVEGNECSKPNANNANEAKKDLFPALPIPLIWAPSKARDAEILRALHGQAEPYAKENQVVLNSENGSILTAQKEDVDIRLEVERMKLDAASHEGIGRLLAKEEKHLYPLPEIPDEAWSDFEHDSFLLALYIFGKDLYLVKKFVETKNMRDVISYYYGPFYKGSTYQRWAKCLRSRSRKSIYGQRMFTGGRQQELFSRLNRYLSDETSNKLVEASKTFKEDGISFEDYVFTLRDLVGTKLLIEVVAVGKGKQDLTGIAAEPLKLNRSVSVHRETQQDKGLSSLSCKEIAQQLTSSRLSKTKSNDLFWEAVWPRLLAGGWHSEQPKDHRVLSLKHQLVFLMPGVNKFRRKKHVKGQHYFDSVTDVLNKVASDPRILELEDEKEKNSGQEENYSEEEDEDLPNGKHNGYLNMCKSDPRKNEMEFMIVDTSKRQGSKVQWMQTLPVHPTDIPSSSSACCGRDSSSEKSDGEGKERRLTKSSKYGFGRESCVGIYVQMVNGIGSLKNQDFDNANIKKRSSKKHHLGGKVKSGPSRYLPPQKRHQVNAAGHEDSSEVTEKKKEKSFILCLPNPLKMNEDKQSHIGLDTQISPLNSSHLVSVGSLSSSLPNSLPKVSEASACMVSENFKEIGKPLMRSLHRAVIDLNIPQVPDDVESNHVRIHDSLCSSSLAENTSLVNKHKDTFRSHTSSTHETPQQVQQANGSNIEQQQLPTTHQEQQLLKFHHKQQLPITLKEQQQPAIHQVQEPNMSGRRHSTRNRPLTTKALEAIESSLFETKKKRKPTGSLTSRPSRRQRGNSKSYLTSDSGIGSNEMTTGTITEEESPSRKSGNALV